MDRGTFSMPSRGQRSRCRALVGIGALVMAVQLIGAGLAHAACAGDCNGDRQVTVNELIVMVNVALEATPASQCEAGDVNGDGKITVEEIVAAADNAISGCAVAATRTPTVTPLPSFTATPTPTPHASIDLGSAAGGPGDTVAMTITLSGGNRQVVAASVDISFDPAKVTAALDADGAPECVINPAIGPGSPAGKSLVSSLPPSSPPNMIVRVGIFGFSASIIPDGLLGTCSFTIVPAATPGVTVLHNKPAAADAVGDPVFVTGADGTITVE